MARTEPASITTAVIGSGRWAAASAVGDESVCGRSDAAPADTRGETEREVVAVSAEAEGLMSENFQAVAAWRDKMGKSGGCRQHRHEEGSASNPFHSAGISSGYRRMIALRRFDSRLIRRPNKACRNLVFSCDFLP